MFCKNCGRQLPDNAEMCPACGTKPSGGAASGSERSGRDIKNLPEYAKEKDLDRSGSAIDTTRQKFSLSDSGQKKFTLSDSGQKKFSLSDSGQKKFTLSGKDRDSGDDIVRVNVNSGQDAPRKEPTGFVNPLRNTGKTVFRDAPAGNTPDNNTSAQAQSAASAAPKADPAPRQTDIQADPEIYVHDNSAGGSASGGETGEKTGFVNPLKDSGQNIRWGSDGDRSEMKNAEVVGDPAEIDSHMGFAIFTLICCCQPTSILAIIFAALTAQEVKKGNYEQARKYSNYANIFCWASIILSFFCGGISSLSNLGELSARLNSFGSP